MVKSFILNPQKLDMWLHQNQAEYTGDFLPGSLLDEFVVATKNGIAAIYEKYVGPYTSHYRVEFERGLGENVMHRWNKHEAAYIAEYGPLTD